MASKDVRIPDPWDPRVYCELHNIFGNCECITGKKDLVDVIKVKDRKIKRLAWIIRVDSISAL